MKNEDVAIMKKEIVEWVDSLDNDSMLQFLKSLQLSVAKNDGDWWNELTPAQKQNVEAGMQDLESGRTLSSEEFWKSLNAG